MSTKMSTDLNINRPTSRVLRAPGGGSSFSIAGGAYEEPVSTPAKKMGKGPSNQFAHNFDIVPKETAEPAAAPASPPRAAPKVMNSPVKSTAAPEAPVASVDESVKAEPVAVSSTGKGTVGILIGGEHATDALSSAVTKALVNEGIKGSLISTVKEIAIVPFAAKKMCSKCDVVIVAAVMSEPSLKTALTQMSMSSDVPIIPGVVVQDSLLEAKVMLNSQAASWAKAAAAVLEMKEGELAVEAAPEPEIPTPVVLTSDMDEPDALVDVLRESLKTHGARGIAGLARKFRIMDDDGSKKLDIGEFTKAINEHALGWTVSQIKIVFDFFDTNKDSFVDFDEFLVGIRGHLNERRAQMVLMAFQLLDADGSGVIEVNDIEGKYNTDKHPDVIAGKRTKEEVLREFLDTFDSIDKDGKVTPDEFIKYYEGVSASIDDDDYFELMMRNAWHISGGEGWCANTSCLRVLVGHTDGRATVEEVKVTNIWTVFLFVSCFFFFFLFCMCFFVIWYFCCIVFFA